MYRLMRGVFLVCMGVCASLSYGWISPGDGNLYTMDTLSVKPATDITNFAGGDVTWDGGGGFYLVGDTLWIRNLSAPDTLIISPGTVVKFTAGMDIILDIHGVFSAVGTSTDTILFTSDAVSPDTADWDQIRFREDVIVGQCQMSYCRVEYARWGIRCK